jgi:hypothetical protein
MFQVEDARATLLLYKLASSAWEKEIAGAHIDITRVRAHTHP